MCMYDIITPIIYYQHYISSIIVIKYSESA